MNRHEWVSIGVVAACASVLVAGCGQKAEPTMGEPAPAAPVVQAAAPDADGDAIVVDVNGKTLTRGQMREQVNERMQRMGGQVPADKLASFEPRLSAQVIDEFVVRTLLNDEADKRTVAVTEEDVSKAVAEIEERLPPGVSLDDLLAQQGMTREGLLKDIRPEIRIQKLVESELSEATAVSDEEIAAFYETERESLSMPENVRARHILVAFGEEDDEAARTAKKEKAEGLRAQLLEGADFEELAKANSDCPSKENGGDLGTFRRGQMVPPFEEAAFTQEIGAIGPLVETMFGYHVVQVVERQAERTLSMDESRETIERFLKQKKEQEAMQGFLQKLQDEATIKRY